MLKSHFSINKQKEPKKQTITEKLKLGIVGMEIRNFSPFAFLFCLVAGPWIVLKENSLLPCHLFADMIMQILIVNLGFGPYFFVLNDNYTY